MSFFKYQKVFGLRLLNCILFQRHACKTGKKNKYTLKQKKIIIIQAPQLKHNMDK